MVITQVIGGLGNQMFQYAAGRALALRMDTQLSLDISGLENYGLHQGYELTRVFKCQVELSDQADIRKVLGWQYPTLVRRIISRRPLASICSRRFIVEPHFHYWPGINQVPRDCYLSGYWQSEKYFQDAAAIIRSDFTFRQPPLNRNAELAVQIERVNAVSVHVRRGDYASNPKTTAKHGMCSLEYYRAAIKYISDRVEYPHFFIFSDDMAWTQENLKLDYPCQYIDHNKGAESYNDMRLMSLCQHHIIANSSFSWWGAWLNSSSKKIVIAPQKWFANETETPDLCPQCWVRV
jgi:Glycosyl transferase family 11